MLHLNDEIHMLALLYCCYISNLRCVSKLVKGIIAVPVSFSFLFETDEYNVFSNHGSRRAVRCLSMLTYQ